MLEEVEQTVKEQARVIDDDSLQLLTRDAKWALVGGLMAAGLSLLGAFGVGRVSGAKALLLLEALLPTARFLSSGVMAAAATILALMLTLLSLSQNTTSELRSIHYHRVRRISFLTVIALVASIVLLSFLILPLQETEAIPPSFYDLVYYTVLVSSAALGGLFTTIVLMLYQAVRALIDVVEPSEAGSYITSSEESGTDNDATSEQQHASQDGQQQPAATSE